MWIRTSDQIPKEEAFYWIFIPPRYIERAWFDSFNMRWCIAEGAYVHDLLQVTHWQPYFTPKPPDKVETFLAELMNDV